MEKRAGYTKRNVLHKKTECRDIIYGNTFVLDLSKFLDLCRHSRNMRSYIDLNARLIHRIIGRMNCKMPKSSFLLVHRFYLAVIV